jgi:hypothetical protein
MTQQEKRIKIAEKLGWTDMCFKIFPYEAPAGSRDNGRSLEELPNYFSSLDACHEMEKAFVGDLKKLQTDAKMHMMWSYYKNYLGHDIHTTATQRAEAFGITMGLWKEIE